MGNIILEAIRERLDQSESPVSRALAPPLMPSIDNLHLLKTLEMNQNLGKDDYKIKLEKYQARLNELTRDPKFKYTCR